MRVLIIVLVLLVTGGKQSQLQRPTATPTTHANKPFKFFHWFSNCDCAPKLLRLGFHDCIKYADGTGGCDGCLNWHGMDVKLEPKDGSRSLQVEDGAGNNGLGDTVRNMERMYTEANFLREGPVLTASPKDLGWSRVLRRVYEDSVWSKMVRGAMGTKKFRNGIHRPQGE